MPLSYRIVFPYDASVWNHANADQSVIDPFFIHLLREWEYKLKQIVEFLEPYWTSSANALL